MIKSPILSIGKYCLISLIALVFFLPLYILIRNAFSSENDIISPHWYFFPATIHFENFKELFTDSSIPFIHSILNSLIIATSQTIGILIISSMAGYAFARYESHYASLLWKLTLISLMLPTAASFVSNYILLASLQWLDTIHGIIIPSLFQAFSVVMFRGYFSIFPKEIEEAAKLDGLSTIGILIRIILPNSLPIFASLGVLIFLESWNSFLWPFIIASDPQNWTIQLSLSTFLTSQSSNFTELFAGTVVSIIPALIVFFSLSQYMIHGTNLSTQ